MPPKVLLRQVRKDIATADYLSIWARQKLLWDFLIAVTVLPLHPVCRMRSAHSFEDFVVSGITPLAAHRKPSLLVRGPNRCGGFCRCVAGLLKDATAVSMMGSCFHLRLNRPSEGNIAVVASVDVWQVYLRKSTVFSAMGSRFHLWTVACSWFTKPLESAGWQVRQNFKPNSADRIQGLEANPPNDVIQIM